MGRQGEGDRPPGRAEALTPDPWQLFELAADESGETRARLLRQVADANEADAELRAVALSQLALTGDVPLKEAAAAVAAAASASGWPNYHLAEAAVAQGVPGLALDHLARIPTGFFESRDLRWRAVRCRELEAVAYSRLGDWAKVAELVDQLATEYAADAAEDDLASPSQLARALLDSPQGRDLLWPLTATLELDAWFEPALAAELRGAQA